MRAAAKGQGPAKKPPHLQNHEFQAVHWGRCKVEHYTEKSYIRRKTEQGNWQLIIGWRGENHWHVVDQLVSAVQCGMKKEGLLSLREEIMKKMSGFVSERCAQVVGCGLHSVHRLVS